MAALMKDPHSPSKPMLRPAAGYTKASPSLTTSLLKPSHRIFDDSKYSVDDITEADMKTISTFGDVVHQNRWLTFTLGIKDDEVWQR